MIHTKLQALFSLKNKSKKIKVSSAAMFVWRFKGFTHSVDDIDPSLGCVSNEGKH